MGKGKSGFQNTGIERSMEVDASKYSGYAKILARESNDAIKNDTKDEWLMYTNTSSKGQSFIRYSLEDNYIAALGSTTQGAGANKLLVHALDDIKKYGNSQPVEWLVYSDSAIKYYNKLGLSKYRTADTYSIPLSDIPKVIKKLKK